MRDCNHPAFIRCAHCGRVLCLEHFLERTCFHSPSERGIAPYYSNSSTVDELEHDDDDFLMIVDDSDLNDEDTEVDESGRSEPDTSHDELFHDRELTKREIPT